MSREAFTSTAYAVRLVEGRLAPDRRGVGLGHLEPFLVVEQAQDQDGVWWPKRQELVEIPHGPEPLNLLNDVRTPEDALRLCSRLGFLRSPGPVILAGGETAMGEQVRLWLQESVLLRFCVFLQARADYRQRHVRLEDGVAFISTAAHPGASSLEGEDYFSGRWLDGDTYVRAVFASTVQEAVSRFLAVVANERLRDVQAAVVRHGGGYKPSWRAETLLGHVWLQLAFWLWEAERFAVCGDCGQVFDHSRALRLPQPLCRTCAQKRRWERFAQKRRLSKEKGG